MVDAMRVRAKLAALRSYRDELRTIGPDDLTPQARFSRRYLVQAGIQVCIDLANHLIASSGWRTATDFRDTFGRMVEHHVVDAALGERLQAMVGMRNRLVYLVDDVDDGLVARVAADDLGDWDAFANAFARYVDSEEPPGRDER